MRGRPEQGTAGSARGRQSQGAVVGALQPRGGGVFQGYRAGLANAHGRSAARVDCPAQGGVTVSKPIPP